MPQKFTHHTDTNETLHTEDPLHTEVSAGIALDPDHVHHTNITTRHHKNHLTAPTKQPGRNKDRKYCYVGQYASMRMKSLIGLFVCLLSV